MHAAALSACGVLRAVRQYRSSCYAATVTTRRKSSTSSLRCAAQKDEALRGAHTLAHREISSRTYGTLFLPATIPQETEQQASRNYLSRPPSLPTTISQEREKQASRNDLSRPSSLPTTISQEQEKETSINDVSRRHQQENDGGNHSLTSVRVGKERAWGFRGGIGQQADQAGRGERLNAETEDALVRHADALAVQRVQELNLRGRKGSGLGR